MPRKPASSSRSFPPHYVYSTGPRISGVIVTNEGAVVVDSLEQRRDGQARAQRSRQVLIDFRDAIGKELAKGATQDQAAATVLLPQYKDMLGYAQQRELLVRRMYEGLKGTLQ